MRWPKVMHAMVDLHEIGFERSDSISKLWLAHTATRTDDKSNHGY